MLWKFIWNTIARVLNDFSFFQDKEYKDDPWIETLLHVHETTYNSWQIVIVKFFTSSFWLTSAAWDLNRFIVYYYNFFLYPAIALTDIFNWNYLQNINNGQVTGCCWPSHFSFPSSEVCNLSIIYPPFLISPHCRSWQGRVCLLTKPGPAGRDADDPRQVRA